MHMIYEIIQQRIVLSLVNLYQQNDGIVDDNDDDVDTDDS